MTYALGVSAAGVDSGLIDSVSGNHVFLFLESGQVVGREGTSAATAVGGPIDFTILVAANGDVTLTQLRAVHELTPEGTPPGDSSEAIHLDSATNLVTLTATITDKDGDHQAATIDLGKQVTFNDDGPTIVVNTSTEPTLVVDESFLTAATNGIDGTTPNVANTVKTGDFSGAFTAVQGADGVLAAAVGTVKLSRTPADAQVVYRHADETQSHELRGNQVDLPTGNYVFTARAPLAPAGVATSPCVAWLMST